MKHIEIQSFCSCCNNCDEYVVSVNLEKSINADTNEHIDLNNYLICNPLIAYIGESIEDIDDIDNPPNFSRAFRKNCVKCWDVVNGSNRTRHINNIHNFNCIEERILAKIIK